LIVVRSGACTRPASTSQFAGTLSESRPGSRTSGPQACDVPQRQGLSVGGPCARRTARYGIVS
jgi:hypothetical protein